MSKIIQRRFPARRILAVSWLTVLVLCSACAAPEDPEPAADRRPNLLLLVADDLGYSDLGAYGGEISTPRLDALAAQGVQLGQFYSSAICSTTRAMLLSGVDHHRAGIGALAPSAGPLRLEDPPPGYEGYLNFDVTPVSELLAEAGYQTYMVGKWHLGSDLSTGPENRGFQRTFILPGGAATHFGNHGATSRNPVAEYREDGERATVPDGFYSSAFYTDKLIEFIDAGKDQGRPFFAYAAYTAPHWPLQAPDAFIGRYRGYYDGGYDTVRRGRIERMVKLGLLPEALSQTLLDSDPTAGNPLVRRWQDLDPALKGREARRMQVYAAMVEALDWHIGRLLDYLEAEGLLANTLVVFLSDNGAEGNDPFIIQDNETWIPQNFDIRTEALGRPGSFTAYGPAWAQVSGSPYRLYKGFPTEGGVRVPAIVRAPGNARRGELSQQFTTVLDIVPTLLEYAGVSYPEGTFRGRAVAPLQGRSLAPYLKDERNQVHDDDYVMGWELFGRRAVRVQDWKLVRVEAPFGPGRWALFDLRRDPLEANDLSDAHPEKLAEMMGYWRRYAEHNNVLERDYSNLVYSQGNLHYQR